MCICVLCVCVCVRHKQGQKYDIQQRHLFMFQIQVYNTVHASANKCCLIFQKEIFVEISVEVIERFSAQITHL